MAARWHFSPLRTARSNIFVKYIIWIGAKPGTCKVGNHRTNDSELETVVGGNWLGDAFRAIGGAIKDSVEWVGGLIFGGLQGPGNQRGPFGPGVGAGAAPFLSLYFRSCSRVGRRLS